MTKQDKVVAQIGPVKIYSGGYFLKKEARDKLIQEDRLLEFSNIDPSKKRSVINFFEKYAFIPRDLTNGWFKAFENEQSKIKSILVKVATQALSQSDLDTIECERQLINKQKPVLINESQFEELRQSIKQLNGNEEIYDKVYKRVADGYIIEVNERLDSISSLWDELYSFIKSKQKIKQCLECKDFFEPDKRSPWQKFCSPKCKDKYNNNHR